MATTRGRMHQTTVRFSEELWDQLEQEAKRLGVSAAQYVRDAALARLAYVAGQRGDGLYGNVPPAGDTQDAVSAVWAQARLARQRAQTVRGQARASQAETQRQRAVPDGGRPVEGEHP